MIARETSIWVLALGVEMWKVTLSKSETTWSMEVGVALVGDEDGQLQDLKWEWEMLVCLSLWGKSVA